MELQNLEVGPGLSVSLTKLFSHRVSYTVSLSLLPVGGLQECL